MHISERRKNEALIREFTPMLWSGFGADIMDQLHNLITAARSEGYLEGRTWASVGVKSSKPKTMPRHPGFLVWNPDGPHRPGYRHLTLESAKTESKRLAVTHPDQNFFVMAPVAAARAERTVLPVTFVTVDPASAMDLEDEIPF